MDRVNTAKADNKNDVYRKAWTAYVAPLVFSIMLIVILGKFNLTLVIIPLVFAIVSVFNIRSYTLCIDKDGVWLHNGILPWSKGTQGVKWEDLDEAVYFTGIMSWALKSYRIKISHRLAKNSEIVLTHMKVGNNAVNRINQQHRESLGSILA